MPHSIPKEGYTGKGNAIYVRDNLSPYCEVLDGLCAKQIVFLRVAIPNNPVFIVETVYRSLSYPLSVFMPYRVNIELCW